MFLSPSLPSNICQIQATLFGNTPPPIDSRTVRPKTRWRKGWRRPFWAVFAPFCTVFAPFRTIFAPFRIVLNRFRTVSSAERCEKFAKTCENFGKIPRKFANRLFQIRYKYCFDMSKADTQTSPLMGWSQKPLRLYNVSIESGCSGGCFCTRSLGHSVSRYSLQHCH